MATILVTGCDGYEGYPLTLRLLKAGHKVLGIDNLQRRRWVRNFAKSDSAIPIPNAVDRVNYLREKYDFYFNAYDLTIANDCHTAFRDFDLDFVINLAAQPSAPFSTFSKANMRETMTNNNTITQNLINSIKDLDQKPRFLQISTMGEYGTPPMKIPQGFLKFTLDRQGNKIAYDLPFPRDPSSWYHLSKVYDTQALYLANKLYGIETDVFCQGVVYGTKIEKMEKGNELETTRFDFDFYFGTVINRFIAQAIIGQPITVYGLGGQTRGMLSLDDAIESICFMMDQKHEGDRKFRMMNNISYIFSVNDLAEKIREVGNDYFDLNVQILRIPNPRKESEYHQYNVDYSDIRDSGYSRQIDFESEISEQFEELLPFKSTIKKFESAMNKTI